jgi:phytoene/squalene synthetase
LLVTSYRQLGRHAAAWETCVKGLKHFPADLELRFQQAAMHYAFGRKREAARAYEELRVLKDAEKTNTFGVCKCCTIASVLQSPFGF